MHTKTETPPPSSDGGDDEGVEKIYNTHVIIDDEGRLRACYHKIHLFDVAIPGKVSLRESDTTRPGTRLVVCDSPIGRLGLSICYDMRFGEMYVDLVQKMGAQVLLMPSAFTVPTGRAHWHALLRGESFDYREIRIDSELFAPRVDAHHLSNDIFELFGAQLEQSKVNAISLPLPRLVSTMRRERVMGIQLVSSSYGYSISLISTEEGPLY